ncbi:MAG: hypothetical protein GY830_09830 [Bacteroidetes bacterium]|nr:hypothetical protein [Bacteroidota bacterium]
MEKRFYEVQIGSPLDYEELVAYIYLSDKSLKESLLNKAERTNLAEGESHIEYIESEEIATVTKEEGPDKMKIRFSEYSSNHDLNLDEIIKAINKAKEELLK